MAASAQIQKTWTIGGKTLTANRTVSDGMAVVREESLPAAQAGDLTTRTSDTAGDLTMDSASHGIETGDRLDLYWVGGMRRDITVGTVSGTTVPISGGSGDVLPSAASEITAMVPLEKNFNIAGDDVVALAVSSGGRGQIVFEDSGGTEHHNYKLPANGAKGWDNAEEETNPIAGDTIAKVFMSHGDSVNTQTMRAAAVID